MKKVFIAILLAGCVPAMAQKLSASKVPAPAHTAFEKSFPGMKDVKWEKEKGNFEANFIMDGNKMSAIYSEKGELVQTETSMEIKQLPPNVAEYVSKNYNGKSIQSAARINKANEPTAYEAVVNGKDLLFGPNGQFIKESK